MSEQTASVRQNNSDDRTDCSGQTEQSAGKADCFTQTKEQSTNRKIENGQSNSADRTDNLCQEQISCRWVRVAVTETATKHRGT